MTSHQLTLTRSRRLIAALAIWLMAMTGMVGAAHADDLADLGAALSYKPLQPVEAQGVTGFDIGVATTFSQMNDSEDVSVTRVNLHKGLPYGFDIGAFFGNAHQDGESNSLNGYELRYALLRGDTALPAIGVRGAYTKLDNNALDLDTKSVDIAISKGFLFLTPYAGIGQVWVDSKQGDASMTKTYAGLNIGLGLFAVDIEVDQTGEVTTYGLKAALRW
ncbi:hypothetical protein AZ34_11700 [Hylemonella gracilis str. Niagara R]|uniref:Outer membrane protein beta-barrel domain-containing protein n=1 Tax=Hylemonella gracilis str. Niagara R TaxID=1458275 RepID=A0A016XJE9_9BURK|nr:hypothetical protein [Hylemonella gracilis]EYC51677.1 hypothetical protein AZ34_11700 [Hylemonella gracilis str. Niagara R]